MWARGIWWRNARPRGGRVARAHWTQLLEDFHHRPQDAIVTLEESERIHIRQELAATAGRIYGSDGAAALLGINPSTLRSRMEEARHHETARVIRTNQYLRTRPPGQPIAVRGGQIVTLTAPLKRPVTPPPGSSSRPPRSRVQAL